MIHTAKRCPAWLVLLLVVCLGRGDALAQTDTADADDAPRRGAWQPPEEDRSAYRDIVDFNIFRSDRSRLAQQAGRERDPSEPSGPGDPEPTEPVRGDAPPSPDSFLRFAGTGHDPDGAVAFIENTKTGEMTRIDGPTVFSLGEITAIGYDAILYVVDGEQRKVLVGQTLLGERVTPPGASTTPSGGSGDAKPPKPGSLEDRLRLLRERRAREQGNAPPRPATDEPAETPQDEDATEAPAQPSAETRTLTVPPRG